MANFLEKNPNFSLPWQQGSSEESFTDTIKLADPENPLVGASIWGVSPAQSYSRFSYSQIFSSGGGLKMGICFLCILGHNKSSGTWFPVSENFSPYTQSWDLEFSTVELLKTGVWSIFGFP